MIPPSIISVLYLSYIPYGKKHLTAFLESYKKFTMNLQRLRDNKKTK